MIDITKVKTLHTLWFSSGVRLSVPHQMAKLNIRKKMHVCTSMYLQYIYHQYLHLTVFFNSYIPNTSKNPVCTSMYHQYIYHQYIHLIWICLAPRPSIYHPYIHKYRTGRYWPHRSPNKFRSGPVMLAYVSMYTRISWGMYL